MSILAIDQGTTSSRALIIDDSGTSKIIKAIKHKQFYPGPGWVEQDAEELLQNIQRCVDCCDDPDLQFIGIDNQGESCLAWHADSKQAVSPVIVWQDHRTQPAIDKLKSDNVQDMVLEKAGLPLDAYFSATKLAWIVENIPAADDLRRHGKLRLGTTDAFFLDRLTGRFVTDISTASRTSLMNLHTGQWDETLCRLFGVPVEALPEIVPTTGDFGMMVSQGRHIPITASIVDQQAALYGHGCRHSGDAKITFGTGAFALVVTGEEICQSASQGLLPTVAWQLDGQKPVYALDGGVYSAGSAINWARSLGLFTSFDEINQFSPSAAFEKDLVFVPALSGLGCPYWDRSAGGMWIGLSLDTRPADLMQSILEGIVLRTAEVIAAMAGFTSVKNEISIDGGLSANPYFCQFLADVLYRRVVVQSSAELTALGVAQLAGDGRISWNPTNHTAFRYLPEVDRRPYLERFKAVVHKSLHWRQ